MNIHPDLQLAENLIYKKLGFSCDNIVLENESQEYAAASFMLNNHHVLFRASKITPTKTGQFVTIWKRINGGPIQPFDENDPIDFVIISVRSDKNHGQFIFPKKILCEKKIFSNHGGGKRAMRVYAPWDSANSKQALATKKWQSEFFVDLNHGAASTTIKKIVENFK